MYPSVTIEKEIKFPFAGVEIGKNLTRQLFS